MVDDAAFFFTNYRFLHGVITGDCKGRRIVVQNSGGGDVICSFKKLIFFGFFCVVCLRVMGSEVGLGPFSYVCLWPFFIILLFCIFYA